MEIFIVIIKGAKEIEAKSNLSPKCLRKSDLEVILNVQRSTRQRITRLPDFPKPFTLGSNVQVWDSAEVYAWIEKQKREHSAD